MIFYRLRTKTPCLDDLFAYLFFVWIFIRFMNFICKYIYIYIYTHLLIFFFFIIKKIIHLILSFLDVQSTV